MPPLTNTPPLLSKLINSPLAILLSPMSNNAYLFSSGIAGETLAVDATVVGSLYDPTNNYPLTLSSLQLQIQVHINRLTNAIAALVRDYNPGSGDYSYQVTIINNNNDIALWYLDNEEKNLSYILLLYPLGNNQFKIKAKIFDLESR
ncbi:hypothetical protein [Arsenophonus endosymbiont of Aleurodicus floccissimus]|uniref:hypothetical protein n=1 Tax=Arsenophonus endosymbiont of Aleurodicus floccissimus TaxID=2152761 RepID=UPI000E6B4BB6|nr:hypothetical protein [Arsenophonus endosymbiont of Aleurodicus floccissimus]